MNEAYLQYIWRHKKLPFKNLKTIDGKPVEILDFGFLNRDSGPDFFNGRVCVDAQDWVGNIEIHIKSSDWNLHKHQHDKAYDNVILHVVYEFDKEILNSKGAKIPTIEIKSFIDENHFLNYENLIKSQSWIPCQKLFKDVDQFYKTTFIERLAIERLERKSQIILGELEVENFNWEEVFYRNFLSSFGTKVNKESFGQIARNTSLSIVQKIGANPFQLEALFLGQAGLLEDEKENRYYNSLKSEHQFLKQKHSLTSIAIQSIKFSKLRPPNFPTIRLAQFSKLLEKRNQWLSFCIESSIEQIKKELEINLEGFWRTHYVFDKESKSRAKRIGGSLQDNILINVVAPFIFLYGEFHHNEILKGKALEIFQKIKPESNSIIEKWNELGIEPKSAFESQALLELKNEYCSAKKCLNCNVGVKLLNKHG